MMLAEIIRDATDTPEAFADWVGPYLERMALVAARLGPPGEAEDIVQDALTRAWRSRGRFEAARGSLGAWLYAITANVARSRFRRPRSAQFRLEAASIVRDVDLAMDLDAAIRQLPDRQALAINCFYAVGLSIADTAAVMGCAEGTVKSTLADARRRLKAILDYEIGA
jgi:RNA polymerase sigma factor (sigma-70 family)